MTSKKQGKAEFARTVSDKIANSSKPDLYNSVAKRLVTIEEAKNHGWIHFFQKVACPSGHIAARYVSNPALCVDCNRIAQGKAPIYPNENGSDLTQEIPTYVAPVANDFFAWTEVKRKQFFTAYINTGSVEQALRAIDAQFSHLIRLLDDDPTFKMEFERVRDTAVAQSQLWKAEGLAMGGSDRAALVMAASKFPDSFGQRAKSDFSARQVRAPGEIRAAFTRLVQRVVGPSSPEDRSRESSAGSPQTVPEPKRDATAGAGGVAAPDGGVGSLVEDDPNSDLVSD